MRQGLVKPSEAQVAFERHLARSGLELDRLTAAQAVEAAIDFFKTEHADDVEEHDGDMLLFQWGINDWRDGKGPSFQFEMARQFIVGGLDPEEADDAMSQLRLTLYYEPSDEAARVGSGHHWCLNTANTDDFAAFIRSTAAMAFATANVPKQVELSLDQVG